MINTTIAEGPIILYTWGPKRPHWMFLDENQIADVGALIKILAITFAASIWLLN